MSQWRFALPQRVPRCGISLVSNEQLLSVRMEPDAAGRDPVVGFALSVRKSLGRVSTRGEGLTQVCAAPRLTVDAVDLPPHQPQPPPFKPTSTPDGS